jgi:tyrosyl-tRNA synthetase
MILTTRRNAFINYHTVGRYMQKRYASTESIHSFIDSLEKRSIIQDKTQNLPKALQQSKLGIYAGFDPTADSLHVGNLLVLQTLKRFKEFGVPVYASVGGATGLIGDPSGRNSERELQSVETVENNVRAITEQITRFIQSEYRSSGHGGQVKVLNNSEWLASMNMLQFLRDAGKHFHVNTMLKLDSVRSRLEQEHGISYTEFTYSLLQSYDFYHLNRYHNVNIQVGGSDQWGNIVSGIDFVKRKCETDAEKKEHIAAGITIPLLTTSDGKKFGKSAGNAIWLDSRKTSAFQFYQFFVRTPDDMVEKLLNVLTLCPSEQIGQVMQEHKQAPEKLLAQKLLATELTQQIHGSEALEFVERSSQLLYMNDAAKQQEILQSLSLKQLEDILLGDHAVNNVEINHSEFIGSTLGQVLKKTPMFPSNAEARKAVKSGAVYVNFARVTDWDYTFSVDDCVANGHMAILRSGKKNYCVIRLNQN